VITTAAEWSDPRRIHTGHVSTKLAAQAAGGCSDPPGAELRRPREWRGWGDVSCWRSGREIVDVAGETYAKTGRLPKWLTFAPKLDATCDCFPLSGA
jgi:hypothetical protein